MLWTDDLPVDDDAFTTDRFTEWFRDSSQVFPVANTTARAAFLADVVAAGITPSSSLRIYVDRADAPSYARIECYNGSSWSPVLEADSGWVAASYTATYDAYSTVQSRRVGPVVHVRGLIRPDSGSFSAAGDYTNIIVMTSGHRPPSGVTARLNCVRWVAGGTPEYRGDASFTVKDSGNVDVGVPGASTGVYVHGTYLID